VYSAGFPDRLRQARAQSGLSIRALATAAGCSAYAVQTYLSGARVPQIGTAERLASALSVEPAWLVYDKEQAK
jgi:transcriptional regulator with XRE-family HTH domain